MAGLSSLDCQHGWVLATPKRGPPELDTMANVFAVVGERQETVADKETIGLLERFALDPDLEKARAEFERAQKVEENFHKDFDGLDFTNR